MYCKNCGKYLEEGTRFCDRCGQSVRKSANSEQAVRHQNIEELKEERLNRKKRLAELEAREAMKNKRKQKRRKKNRGVTAFMVTVLLLAVVAIILSYSITRCSSEKKNNAGTNGEVTATQTPAVSGIVNNNTVTNTASPQTSQAPQNSAAPVVSDGEYRVFEINNVACPYPSDFSKKAVSGNEKLSLVDSVGGGIMSISQEQGVSDTPAELMKAYARTNGINPSYSLADKTGYTITSEKNNTVYHRKCIISGNTAIYYDFEYSSMSSSRARYEQCVAYIDSNMGTK